MKEKKKIYIGKHKIYGWLRLKFLSLSTLSRIKNTKSHKVMS